MRSTTNEALNHLLAGIQKHANAELSSLTHFWTAIAMLRRLSPGWRPPDKLSSEMVEEAEDYLRTVEEAGTNRGD